jgi:hypothetical protein
VQLIAFDEPMIKPKPLATLQVSVPIFTPLCAEAGAGIANATPTVATMAAAKRILLDIPSLLSCAVPGVSLIDDGRILTVRSQ